MTPPRSSLPVRRLPTSIWLALAVLLFLVVAALIGPFCTGYDPDKVSGSALALPGLTHWFGTDFLGRDILTRLLEGARISLLVGVVGALVSLLIGVSYGAIAAYAGGRVDNMMMRVVDVLYALPTLIFVIILVAVMERPVTTWLTALGGQSWGPQARILLLFIGLGCVEWLTMARVIRGQVLLLKEMPYIHAARVLGQSNAMILFRHILPNLLGLIMVYLTLTIPSVILLESFLSFLGLGVQAPTASLGTLLSDGAQTINPIRMAWWLLFFPSCFLALLLLALNFLGDGLRDLFDPRSQSRR